jgi:hypothetical protein
MEGVKQRYSITSAVHEHYFKEASLGTILFLKKLIVNASRLFGNVMPIARFPCIPSVYSLWF